MTGYLIRRTALAVPTLFGITVLIFVAMRVMPGDVLAAMFGAQEGAQRISEQDRERLLESLGLNEPLYEQYFSWLGNILRGDFGESFWRGEPVRELFIRRGPVTAGIAVFAVTVSWVVGLPIGIISAVRSGSYLD